MRARACLHPTSLLETAVVCYRLYTIGRCGGGGGGGGGVGADVEVRGSEGRVAGKLAKHPLQGVDV